MDKGLAPNYKIAAISCQQNARLSFTNLRHLWRWSDTRLSIKGRVHTVVVRSVPLHDAETRTLKAEDMRRHWVFERHCLRLISII